jgi:type I restriction enzyme M protein
LQETEQSKIFPNAAFGYWKVTVERPLRLARGRSPTGCTQPRRSRHCARRPPVDEAGPPVIKKVHKKGTAADPLRGFVWPVLDGKPAVVEYEPDADLRDTEQVPLLEAGGIEAFLRREVLPYAPDAWHEAEKREGRLRNQLHALLLPAAAACGRWRRFGPRFWHWSRKPMVC